MNRSGLMLFTSRLIIFCMLYLPWLLFASVSHAEQLRQEKFVRFVSCPLYRDTRAGRKSGCWLADDPTTGIRYDITTSPSKPDWNYLVLVEGVVSDSKENLCGGSIMNPVRVSVLSQTCPRHMLPAEDFPGRPYSLPERNVKPLSMQREVPPGPYTTETFYIFFDLNKDFIIYQFGDYFLDRAINWIRIANPEKIQITGYAATEPETISGYEIVEKPQLARLRAEKLREALIRLGVDEKKIKATWKTNPQPVDVDGADDIPSASLRRVEIKAMF